MGTTGLHVQQHYWPCYDASNVDDYEKSTVYTIDIEINRAIYKSKPVKETCVNIHVVPLEFPLDRSI